MKAPKRKSTAQTHEQFYDQVSIYSFMKYIFLELVLCGKHHTYYTRRFLSVFVLVKSFIFFSYFSFGDKLKLIF